MRQRRRRGLQKRRQRENKTNYHKRLKLLASTLPRLVVRKSSRNVSAQIIEYMPAGDKVLASTTTKELEKKYGWKSPHHNIPAAYLAGYILGKKAQKKSIKKAICDIGLHSITKGSVLFACVKGAIDAGLDVPHSESLMPPAERIEGKHLKKPVPFQEIKTKIDATLKR